MRPRIERGVAWAMTRMHHEWPRRLDGGRYIFRHSRAISCRCSYLLLAQALKIACRRDARQKIIGASRFICKKREAYKMMPVTGGAFASASRVYRGCPRQPGFSFLAIIAEHESDASRRAGRYERRTAPPQRRRFERGPAEYGERRRLRYGCARRRLAGIMPPWHCLFGAARARIGARWAPPERFLPRLLSPRRTCSGMTPR